MQSHIRGNDMQLPGRTLDYPLELVGPAIMQTSRPAKAGRMQQRRHRHLFREGYHSGRILPVVRQEVASERVGNGIDLVKAIHEMAANTLKPETFLNRTFVSSHVHVAHRCPLTIRQWRETRDCSCDAIRSKYHTSMSSPLPASWMSHPSQALDNTSTCTLLPQ